MEADRASIVRNFIAGEYDHPISVLACNQAEGLGSRRFGRCPLEILQADVDLTAGTREFVETILAKSITSKIR